MVSAREAAFEFKKDLILKVAAENFFKKGYTKTRIDDITSALNARAGPFGAVWGNHRSFSVIAWQLTPIAAPAQRSHQTPPRIGGASWPLHKGCGSSLR